MFEETCNLIVLLPSSSEMKISSLSDLATVLSLGEANKFVFTASILSLSIWDILWELKLDFLLELLGIIYSGLFVLNFSEHLAGVCANGDVVASLMVEAGEAGAVVGLGVMGGRVVATDLRLCVGEALGLGDALNSPLARPLVHADLGVEHGVVLLFGDGRGDPGVGGRKALLVLALPAALRS